MVVSKPPIEQPIELIFDEQAAPTSPLPLDKLLVKSPEPVVVVSDHIEASLLELPAITMATPEPAETEMVVITTETTAEPLDVIEVEALLEPVLLTEANVLDVYSQLLALVAAATAENFEDTQLFDDELGIALFNDNAEPQPVTNNFERLMSEQVVPETVPSFETIQESAAAEQPLENTLIELAWLLAEVPDADEGLTLIINELVAAIGETDLATPEAAAIVQITPEITEKLLAFLELLGYENPSEILVAFVTQHNLELLYEAIRHLAQLMNPVKSQEFLNFQPLSNLLPDYALPLTNRIGKQVLRFVRGNLVETYA